MLDVQQAGLGGALAPPRPFDEFFETSDEMHTPQIDEALENARANCAREIADLKISQPHGGTLLICGGGPSLLDTFEQVKRRVQRENVEVIAINDAYDWLVERDVIPRYFAMAEIAPWPKDFLVNAKPSTTYLLADIAHPSAYSRLYGFPDVIRWHLAVSDGDPFKEPYYKLLNDTFKLWYAVQGGEAVSTKAISLGIAMGYRDFEMYGVDACYRDGTGTHAYFNRPSSWPELVSCGGRQFLSPYYLARQANDIRRMCEKWDGAFTLRCYGDGLVQHMHRTAWPEQYAKDTAIAMAAHRAMCHGI